MKALAAALTLLLALPAAAQSFPERPIRVLIPYAGGGTPDTVGRLIGQKFQESTGQSLVIDNRGGAGGLIAADNAAKSAPDGYTLVMASAAQISIARALHAQMAFDPENDLVPITHLIDTPMILFAGPGFAQGGVKEVVAAAKAKPGTVPVGSTGNGTISHLALELFSQYAGVQVLHVPYRGAAQPLNDMMSGSIHMMFTTIGSAKSLLDSGKVRPLAVASAKRTPALPDLPTFTELGFAGVEAPVWFGMMAPKGTPPAVIAKLHAEFSKALAAPDIQARLLGIGADPGGAGPEAFRAMVKEDFGRWEKVVKAGNVKIE